MHLSQNTGPVAGARGLADRLMAFYIVSEDIVPQASTQVHTVVSWREIR